MGVRVLKLSALKVRAQAGPVASFIVNKGFVITKNGIETEDDQSPVTKNDFNSVNWGLQIGGGIDFMFLTADLRYEIGLNKIYELNDIGGQTITGKNHMLFISVGFKILSL